MVWSLTAMGRCLAGTCATLLILMLTLDPTRGAEASSREVWSEIPEATEVIAAYLEHRPELSEGQALDAWRTLEDRLALLGDLQRDFFDVIADVEYDPMSRVITVWHVGSSADSAAMNELVESRGFGFVSAQSILTHRELTEVYSAIIYDGVRNSQPKVNAVEYNGPSEQMRVLAATEEDRQSISEAFADYEFVAVVGPEMAPTFSRLDPTVCTTVSSCGRPLRTGVRIGYDPDGPGPIDAGGHSSYPGSCSEGFTARNHVVNDYVWVITAGHCDRTGPSYPFTCSSISLTDGCWGHGQQFIGPVREAVDIASLDYMRIRNDNPYWVGAPRGYIYNRTNPDSPFRVDSIGRSGPLAPIVREMAVAGR